MIMEHKKKIKKTIEVTEFLECDRCLKKFESAIDIFEIQEFWRFKNVGGYSSIFGDGTHLAMDLCQHCVKEILEPFIKIKKG